jgi:hypothetical protein
MVSAFPLPDSAVASSRLKNLSKSVIEQIDYRKVNTIYYQSKILPDEFMPKRKFGCS